MNKEDEPSFQIASKDTLILAFKIGLVSILTSIILGAFYHIVLLFLLWQVVYFIVLRQYWYHKYKKALKELK